MYGAPVAIASPLDAQRLGIGIIYQELDLFPNLTAGENIVIGNLHFPEGRASSISAASKSSAARSFAKSD